MTVRQARRILVCEDETDLQSLIGKVLWDRGHEVEYASTGEAAVERVSRGGIDLLILDLVLTGMSGQEVLERLRALALPPRVVVVTGCNDYPTFARAMRQGAGGYLVKPFRLNVLLNVCEGVFRGEGEAAVPERRAERRHAMGGTVRIMDRRGAGLASGTLVDLSPGGAQVQLASPLEVRSLVRLAADAASGLQVEVEGSVAWRGTGPRGLAHGLGFAHAS